MIELYAYVRSYDRNDSEDQAANHAPHFANGMMSLANCKPTIRQYVGQHNKIGSWLVGLTSPSRKGESQRYISYIARIDGIIDRAAYWAQFPRQISGGRWDNFYEPDGDRFIWHTNPHHITQSDIRRDLSSRYILLSNTWRDFGPDTKQPVPWEWMLDSLSGRKGIGQRRFPLAAPINLDTLEINLCL